MPRNILSKDAEKFMVRLPDGVREELQDLADFNDRSMNSEAVLAITNRISVERLKRLHKIEKMALINQIDTLQELLKLVVSDDPLVLNAAREEAQKWLHQYM